MAVKHPEVKFKAWLGRDEVRPHGKLWLGAGSKEHGIWWADNENNFLASLRISICKVARQLLSHVAPGKRRRVEITVKFL